MPPLKKGLSMTVVNLNLSEQSIKPIASFKKSISGKSHRVDLYAFSKEQLKKNNERNNDFLHIDPLNPRLQTRYNAISNADLDAQIIRHGQIMAATGRYQTDKEGVVVYNDLGFPVIGILDGSRRFDCCQRNEAVFLIEVGCFDENIAESIVQSCVDSQQDLSSLELGIMIGELEIKAGRTLEAKEVNELLPYEKSKFAISHARKAMRLYSKYPSIFNVFPVISLVGKQTISKLDVIVKWAEDNHQMDILQKFCDSELFEYETEDSLFTFEELQDFDSKSNNVILDAMKERIGVKEKPAKKKITTDICDGISYELKANNKAVPRSEKLVIIEAELNDEERSVTESFFRTLTEISSSGQNQDVSLTKQFEMLFRQIG